jgi:antitoxin (DNA-binding transcriptional repressor) of toxin-antitoxin stability system
MRTATVADLRNNFRLISSWIEHGETVQILKRGRAFAQLAATPPLEQANMQKVDFMAQLREIWGDRTFSDAEVQEMRDAERENDWG